MKMKRKFVIVLLIFLPVLLSIIPVSADDWPSSEPFEIHFENYNRVFLFYPRTFTHSETGYLKSGLYYNTDPPENIYLLNPEYAAQLFYKLNLVFSECGIYFAYFPSPTIWLTDSHGNFIDGVAVRFYANGILSKQHSISQLVEDETQLQRSDSSLWWESRGSRRFDSGNNTLSVTTIDGITHIFDITTGNIIKDITTENTERNDRGSLFIVLVTGAVISCILIILILVFFRIKTRLYNNKKNKKIWE